ncbi:MAG: DNA polymerase III subunit delta [Bacilli bacterium]
MIYLYFGKQAALVKRMMEKTADAIIKTRNEFNFATYAATQTPIQEIIAEAEQMPFMSEKRVILVEDAYFFGSSRRKESIERLQDYDKLQEYLQNPNPDTTLIFGVFDEKLAKKNRELDLIKAIGEIKEIQDVSPSQWPEFAKNTFARRNIPISDEALEELLKRIENDVMLFFNEVDKLELLGRPVSWQDIDLLVNRPYEERSYLLTNAVLAKNLTDTLTIYYDLLASGQEPITLIGMLANQFRIYSQVFILEQQGLSQKEMASTLGIHEYRVKLAGQMRRKMSLEDVLELLEQLHQLDYQIKSNRIDRFYALELFLVDYCLKR